ncbi:interleukin-like EMT inducer domain-containing protein [Zunongwangia sp.]|uniref:interleukin-like EMT inducer domain-containing protein n=1 Tax=Zunongwangia sp. TaxID=1965325 RepID=UPI003AA8D710
MIKVLFTILSVLMLHYSFAQTSIYIKGSGFNNNSQRKLILNGIDQNIPSGRGLCLTIIDAESHQHISSKVYDTYISTSNANNLASKLNSLNQKQIGILTSYDAWEANITKDLIRAARRLGLYKFASDKFTEDSRHPYASIF